MEEIREKQAKKYWEAGFGKALKYSDFESYLASIPEVPEHLKAPDKVFKELILVEPRLSIRQTCQLMGIGTVKREKFLPVNETTIGPSEPYWIRALFHRYDRFPKGKTSVRAGRDANAQQGLCCFFQYSQKLKFQGISFLGSALASGSNQYDNPSLWYSVDDDQHPPKVELNLGCNDGDLRPEEGIFSIRI